MGVLTARPRRPASPAPRRARGPLLWSLALHAAVLVTCARGIRRDDVRADVVFTVSVASAAQEEWPEAAVEPDPPPVPPEPTLLRPADDTMHDDAAPEPPEPAPEAPLPDEPPDPTDTRSESIETLGPRTATTLTRRPVPARTTTVAPAPTPPPVAPPPAPTPIRAVPPSPATASASAVEGARPEAGNQPPAYPTDARAHRWTGVVTLRLAVDAAGAVRGVELETSSGYASLDEAAVAAAWGWRFSPARRDGVPFASSVRRRIRFVLEP